MAKLVKTFIGQLGGMAAKMTGGDDAGEKADSDTGADADDASSCNSVKSPTELSRKLSLSSGDEDRESHGGGAGDGAECPARRGYLSKWTNYLHGWQDRYVVVAEGILSYYKSESDTQFGCRGSISLHQVRLLLHEFDDLRFDIRVHDCTYFFRASCREELVYWTDTVEGNRRHLAETGFTMGNIRRQPSILSLSAISQASTSSVKLGYDFQTKLAEIETYRDILCRQVDTLQGYFDSLAENNGTGKFNGVHQSSESFEKLSEEEAVPDDDLSATSIPNSSPFTRPQNPTPSKSSTVPPPTTHPAPVSPLAHHRSSSSSVPQKSGHRRTGSDPFSFAKPLPPRAATYHLKVPLHHPPINPSNIDFRGEAITFKATTAGIIVSLSHCIDALLKREEHWQRKYEREEDKRRRAEVAAHAALNGPRIRAYKYAGPDFVEGPHTTLSEEEFFDALEMAYKSEEDREGEVSSKRSNVATETQKERERKEASLDKNSQNPTKSESGQEDVSTEHQTEEGVASSSVGDGVGVVQASCPEEITHKSLTGVTHRLTPLVSEKISQYARYLFEEVDNNWSVVHEDGDMKVYRREMEDGGVVVDPLKSFYTASRVSAREITNYFFEYDTRLEWEGTVESATILETLAEDTIIFHQFHKRVWPSTQRDTVFCSHLCTLPNAPREENQVGHTWMVGNFSIDHPKAPVSSKLIRATFQCGMVCQTVANRPVEPGKEAKLTRDDISCRILYATNVNPGGWAPPAVVRTIGKREITKFLKRFSGMAQKKTSTNPLSL